MEAWIQHLLEQSVGWAIGVVAVVTFLESLALVGLILPGTVMMASLGALIGSGHISLYPAWGAGLVGCLVGDWLSFYIGWKFQGPLHRWKYLQKYQALLSKTEHALHNHSIATIIIGRFVGPTRPLIPLIAGMLELPVKKFLLPSIVGCLLWPPVYLLPGILAGVAIDIPAGTQDSLFKWYLAGVAVLIWLSVWLSWRWSRSSKVASTPSVLTATRLRYLTPLTLLVTIVAFVLLLRHPMMPIFGHLVWKVFIGH
ncbi:DedA family protein [Rosenbergiella australiborealis]|uniref:DedA family protein n=1 Tax=Rosenbergiella australiborealis TaxID=1544696 RepID=A0ABS5T1F7_9GAMM|nr:DedA family protein [Rosenbergiella australiborealis]MBT0726159.1 DedA family protein [Rosenbergiella australiborealis]